MAAESPFRSLRTRNGHWGPRALSSVARPHGEIFVGVGLGAGTAAGAAGDGAGFLQG